MGFSESAIGSKVQVLSSTIGPLSLVNVAGSTSEKYQSTSTMSHYGSLKLGDHLSKVQSTSNDFGEDKTKSIIFGSRGRLKVTHKLDIRRWSIKSYSLHYDVQYLGCIFDCNTSGEVMAVKVLKVQSMSTMSIISYRKQVIHPKVQSTSTMSIISLNLVIHQKYSLRLRCPLSL